MSKISKTIACVLGTVSMLYCLWMLAYVPLSLYLSIYLIFSLICFLYAYYICKYNKSIFSNVSKIWKRIFIGILTCTILFFVSVEGIILYYGHSHYEEKVDYIMVLGAEVKGDTISTSLKYRLDAAYELHLKQPNTLIVVSGGKGSNEFNSEAYYMKEYLVSKGVPPSLILLEDKSTNTNENFKYSKAMMDKKNGNYEVTIITNGFHSFRSNYIAKKLGMNVHSYSAKMHKITAPHFYIREFFAFVKDFIVLNI